MNFPTKKHWREKSKPEYIEAGLKKFVETYDEKGIVSISFPLLGCGNGELDWELQVRPLMEEYLKPLPINVYIHLYQKNDLIPEHQDTNAISNWLHGEPENLAFTEFWNDLISIIKTKSEFETLYTNSKFEVRLDEKQDGTSLLAEGKNLVYIPKEDNGWLDFWQYIRLAKYCRAENFPMGLDVYAPYVVGFLSELDYIHPVRLSRNDNEPSQIGLQLVPRLISKEETEFKTSFTLERVS